MYKAMSLTRECNSTNNTGETKSGKKVQVIKYKIQVIF